MLCFNKLTGEHNTKKILSKMFVLWEYIFKAHRQPPNLKSILCHSAFRPQKDQETSPKVRKCKNPRCGMCPHIEETSQISLNSNETEKFKIKEEMDCDFRNLIYCVACSDCGEKYIGQTGDVIRNRVRVHQQQILRGK